MLKKLASLLLSLLLCLSLLPGRALASDEPAPPVDPPVIVEPAEPEEPEEPEEPPVMPMAEVLDGKDTDYSGEN